MHLRHILRTVLLAAITGAALVAEPVLADNYRRIVRDGETLTWPEASYTYYRFIVKDRSSNNGFRIAELALYDKDGNRVNQGLTAASDGDKVTTNLLAGTYALYRNLNQETTPYESFDKMFDGNLSTSCNSWISTLSTEGYWWYFVMRPADGANPVFSYNVALPTSETDKSPRSWALQASNDHESWITLDEYDAAAAADAALSSGGWCNGGENIRVDNACANIFVDRGGTFSVTAPAEAKSAHAYGGAVSIASGATLGIDVSSGESARFTGGVLAGAGTFEKTGAGTLAVSGVNSGFGGRVKASGGTLAFRSAHVTPKFTYYRFVLTSLKDMSDNNLELAEFALYDAHGERINMRLSMAADPEWNSTNLLPGTYSKYGHNTTDSMSTNAVYLFDGKLNTKMTGWCTRSDSITYWVYCNMRLPEASDVAPASYNVAFGRTDRAPSSWMVQGSDDNKTWFTLDKRDSDSVAGIKPSDNDSWCNNGVPLPLVWEGDNAPSGEVDAKFFRFTVKAVGGTDGTRLISELSLYDMQGKRLNVGLASMGLDYSGTLPAGSFSWHYQYAGTYANANTHEDKMFDEDLDTLFQAHSLNYQSLVEGVPDARWHKWTMRLADDAPPVASYNFAPYNPSAPSSYPANWLVEASRDGTTWFQVDARSGEAATALFPTERGYCNGGRPIGFTAGLDRWLCPTGAVVEVANGATLEIPASAPNTVSGLAADLTAASPLGTIANFNPAAAGTLYLTTATAHPMLENYALPITFTGLANAANVENWNVVVNGVAAEVDEYVLRFDENDVLRVTRKLSGTVMYLR